MRRKIAAANWKMNTTVEDGKSLLRSILGLDLNEDVDVVICPPATHLYALKTTFAGHEFYLGAQNLSEHESGAYTGEVSAAMLTSCGVSHVIIGHSERREYFGEEDALLGKKLLKALEHKLTPILCCGEVLPIRKEGRHIAHVLGQLDIALSSLTSEQVNDVIIAYEPVWAIGTGETASPLQAQEMHREIRKFLEGKFGSATSGQVPILYGGSVKPANAKELFEQPDVDGGLIGGASLDAESYAAIVNSF